MKRHWVLLLLFGLYRYCYGQITVTTTVEHVKCDGIDTKGAIYLGVSGGNSPYTYSWSPSGLTVKDFTNAPIGTHTLFIKDNSNATYTQVYRIGYKTDWNYFFGSVNVNDSLYSDGSSGTYNQTAVSNNILRPFTDGYIELVVRQANFPSLLGFSNEQNPISEEDFSDVIYGFHISTYGDLYHFNGSYFVYLGSTSVNDVLRVERAGDYFYLYKNEEEIYSSSSDLGNLRAKGLISTSALVDVGLSFADSTTGNPLKVHANVNHTLFNGTDSLGSIGLKVFGGSSPYTYSWSPNIGNSNFINSINRGTYTLVVNDYDSNQVTKVYKLGYNTDWSYFWGCEVVNDSLYSNGSSGTYNQTSTSNNILRANQDGFIQLVVQNANMPSLLGFTPETNPISEEDFWDVNFGFHISTTGVFYFFNGSYFVYLGTTELGDVIEVERSGSNFNLKQNGSVVYNSTATNAELRIKGLISTSALVDVGVSFADSTTNQSFKVIADVNHINNNGIDSLGSVKLNITGGSSPYSYSWTPNNYSGRDLINVPKGTYSVHVSDYNGNYFDYVYNLGYKTGWSNYYATEERNDSLVYNGYTLPVDSFPTSRTIDSLAQDSSGWAELVIRPFVAPIVIGFVRQVDPNYTGSIYDIDFAMHVTYDNELYVWELGNWYYIGRAAEGDIIRIAREASSNLFEFYWNNAVQFTSTKSYADPTQIKAQLVGPPYTMDWAYIKGLGLSWFKKCNLSGSIAGNPEIVSTYPIPAVLNLNATGAVSPYSVIWNPNSFYASTYSYSQNPTQVAPPVSVTYTATLTDAIGCKLIKTVDVLSYPFAPLNKIPDGGYYKTVNNKMLFKYDGQYANTTLNYKVYNKRNANVTANTSLASLSLFSGDNRYSLDVSSLGSGYYTLEVINEKNEKMFLRFER